MNIIAYYRAVAALGRNVSPEFVVWLIDALAAERAAHEETKKRLADLEAQTTHGTA